MNHLFNQKKEAGFTLIEALVAISIFSVSVVVLMSLLNQNINGIRFAKEKMVAVYLAQEGIEYFRNMKDTYTLYGDTTGNSWSVFQTKVSACEANDCGINISLLPTDSNSTFLCSVQTCQIYLQNGNYNSSSQGVYSGFTRKIRIKMINADEIKVTSAVNFTKGGTSFNTILSEEIFNWAE